MEGLLQKLTPCHMSKSSRSLTSWTAGEAKSCSGPFPCPWWACQWLPGEHCFCRPCPVPPQLQGATASPRGDPQSSCCILHAAIWEWDARGEEVPLHMPLIWRWMHPPLYQRHLWKRRKANVSPWLPVRLQYNNVACELPTAHVF